MDKPKIIIGKAGSGKDVLSKRLTKGLDKLFITAWHPEFQSDIHAIHPSTEVVILVHVNDVLSVRAILERGHHEVRRYFSQGEVVVKVPVVITTSTLNDEDFKEFDVDVFICERKDDRWFVNGDRADKYDVEQESSNWSETPEKPALIWDGQPVVINSNLVGVVVTSYWTGYYRCYRVLVDAQDSCVRVANNSIDQTKDLLQLKQDLDELMYHSQSSFIMNVDERKLNVMPEFIMKNLALEDSEFDEKLEKQSP